MCNPMTIEQLENLLESYTAEYMHTSSFYSEDTSITACPYEYKQTVRANLACSFNSGHAKYALVVFYQCLEWQFLRHYSISHDQYLHFLELFYYNDHSAGFHDIELDTTGYAVTTYQFGEVLASESKANEIIYPLVSEVICVDQLPDKIGDFDVFFVDSDFEVKEIKEYLGNKAEQYDSFFVCVGNGDYIAVWGMFNIVPWFYKSVERLV